MRALTGFRAYVNKVPGAAPCELAVDDSTNQYPPVEVVPSALATGQLPKSALSVQKPLSLATSSKPSIDRPAEIPFIADNDGLHMILVKVARFGQRRAVETTARVEDFIVRASTTLEILTEMTAARIGVPIEDQILCFGNVVLRSFMQDSRKTVATDTTLGCVCPQRTPVYGFY